MKRSIITIDDTKCNGCGLCVPNCPEGAIQMINGKARLVSDLFCDGLGACIGHCPQGAITIEEREAVPYDERKTMDNIIKGGADVIKAHLQHLKEHGQTAYLDEALAVLNERGIAVPAYEPAHAGCPGMMMRDRRAKASAAPARTVSGASALRQWPVQLQLVNSRAPYFQDADLLVAADCTAFAFGAFHQEFLEGKTLVVFCPKLDKVIDQYVDKLADIFQNNTINSITVLKMEVPCCHGTRIVVDKALEKAGKQIPVVDRTIGIDGELMAE